MVPGNEEDEKDEDMQVHDLLNGYRSGMSGQLDVPEPNGKPVADGH